ncbi:MAG: GatB/YqeY domain-containing protein [Gemmatimonadetes bacterium]|nr:GatB/YqeY domain-containing protein [Gemmatimonadota bacterium]
MRVRPSSTCTCICSAAARSIGPPGSSRREVPLVFFTMADALKTRLQSDLNRARKDRDRERTLVLSTILSELKNREIELGRDASDDDAITVFTRAIKQRRESAEQMRAGARTDLADNEDAQAEILKGYLPEGLSEDQVRSMIREVIAAGADQMGGVMGQLMPRLKGRFDGKEANRLVREALAK